MDQDLDLTQPSDLIQEVVPPVILQPTFSTDELFKKLQDEKNMTWTQVMEEIVDWIDLKFPESDNMNILDRFNTFNILIFNFYSDLK